MSDFENQYNSPETQVVMDKTQAAGNLTETMLFYLKEASPWLRFMGILGYIGCGFIIFFGIILAIVSNALSDNILGEFSGAPVWITALFYTAMGVVFFFPARFTYNFGTLIRKYQYSHSENDLEQAFKNNKSLWKFNGIIYIIMLSLIPVILIVSLIIGIAAAARFF
jgi:hypothetical protein